MHWEAPLASGPAGPGWHPDPLEPTRLRWWDGTAWTARVARLEAGSDAISWHAGIADLAAPEPFMELPSVPARPLDVVAMPPVVPVPTMADSFDEADVVVPPRPRHHVPAIHLPSTRRAWAVLAAAVTLLLVGAGVSAALLSKDERPTVEPRLTYADRDADFAFQYPERWRIERPTGACPNVIADAECIQVVFEVGPDVRADEANTLQVRSVTSDGDLGALHEWVTEETQIVVDRIPNFRLVSAEATRLADAPAFTATLVDATESPPTRLIVYEGRTTSGRALTVTLTVRDPRTAPTDEEFRRFLASITSS